jgi:hypothetical protein
MSETQHSQTIHTVVRNDAQEAAHMDAVPGKDGASGRMHGLPSTSRQMRMLTKQRGLCRKTWQAIPGHETAGSVPHVTLAHLQLEDMFKVPKLDAQLQKQKDGTDKAVTQRKTCAHEVLPTLKAHVHARVGARAVHMKPMKGSSMSSCSTVLRLQGVQSLSINVNEGFKLHLFTFEKAWLGTLLLPLSYVTFLKCLPFISKSGGNEHAFGTW